MYMMTIMPAKTKPEKVSKEAWDEIVKLGEVTVPAITAREALKNSKGGYVIKPPAVPKAEMVMPSLDEIPDDQLRQMYLTSLAATGKRPGKKVTRAQMKQVIRQSLDAIEIVDEE